MTRRSPWRKRLVWTAAVLLAYTLLGFFAVPPLLKWQLVKRLPGLTHRQATVRQVRFNPFALSVTVRGLSLTEADGRRFVAWEEFYANFQLSSLFRRAWTFSEIRLEQPFGEVILAKDGQLNFANLFAAPTNAAPAAKPPSATVPRVNIFLLQVTNGFVIFEDRARRSLFRTEYRPINLTLNHFTTRPDADSPYAFRAESDAGRSVTWAGDLTVQPLRSRGHLEITGVNLSRYQPYLEDFTRARLTNGIADVEVTYQFAADTNGLDLLVTNGLVHVERMQLLDPDTGETIAGFGNFNLEQAQINWRERAARVGNVRLSEAVVLARLKRDGRLNLLDLLTPPSASPHSAPTTTPASQRWTIAVDDVVVEKAAVALEDLTRRNRFRTDLKPIEFQLKYFSTKPNSDARYSFRLTSESAETVAGEGTLSIDPVRSAGEIRLAAVDVKKYLPYFDDIFRGRLAGGRLSVQAPYYMALTTNGLRGAVLNLAATVTGLEVKAPGAEETVTRLTSFGVEQVEADLEERRARVGRLKAEGGSILVRRHQDGSINLLGLVATGPTNAPAALTNASLSSKRPPWELRIDEVALKDYTVKVEDQRPAKPVTLLLDQLAMSLKDISNDNGLPISANVSSRLNQTGGIALDGTARLSPLSADFQLGLTNLDLRAAQSFIEPFVRLGIVSGALNTFGRGKWQAEHPAGPRVSFSGGVSITNLLCTDQVGFKEFMRWDELALAGIDFGLRPNRLKIDQVKWVAPRASLLIGPDHRPNLSLILKQEEGASSPATNQTVAAPAASQPGAEAFPVEVGSVRLERASFAFADESIQPAAKIGLEELTGSIRGLSSALNTTAEVELAGKVDQQSPFTIQGRVNPLATDLFIDLVISNANTQLTPITPYMEKYAGHALTKGRLSTRLHYQVEGKALKADNKVSIDHLTLGPRNSSPDATTLPLKLAVALLKDSNGRIELDLPMHGRLDDPQFKLGPIILKTLLNTLAKAAASPFKLLGALAGGGEELSSIAFAPGGTNLVEGELEKLEKLAKALAQRPALSLEIEGAIDPAADREALARNKLRENLKVRRLQELGSKGKPPEAAGTFQLETEDYERLLRGVFAEQFGTNIAAILQTNPPVPAAMKPSSEPKPAKATGKAASPLGWIGLGSGARPSEAEKHLPKADRLALEQAGPALLEQLIAAKIPVVDEDYRALMTSRARWIQDWLMQSGQVGGERLLLIAPKPVDANYKGQSRVNLSLQ